jgi:hypothetical protein
VHRFLPTFLLDLPATTFLVPFVVSTLLILPFPQARETLRWFKKGTIDRTTVLLIFLTGILSTFALITWAFWTNNLGVGEKMMGGFADLSLWLVAGVGIPLFALVNAFAEEVVYRGVAQQALASVFSSVTLVIALQASAFAAAHVRFGFPNGMVGYLMVGVYGGMLGYLRYRSEGMLAPYVTHVIADLTIGYFLYFHVRSFL